jgi:hypothetical protein
MDLRQQLENRRLGRDAGLLQLHSAADNALVAADLLAQTRRELCLLSQDLDRPVFDRREFLDGLRELALRSSLSRIRILLQDHRRVVRQGHRVIELARRLTSSLEIRVPSEDWLEHPENFLLADQYGYLHRELSTRYLAAADYHAPLVVRRLRLRFDEIWETAQADSELRRLYI